MEGHTARARLPHPATHAVLDGDGGPTKIAQWLVWWSGQKGVLLSRSLFNGPAIPGIVELISFL